MYQGQYREGINETEEQYINGGWTIIGKKEVATEFLKIHGDCFYKENALNKN